MPVRTPAPFHDVPQHVRAMLASGYSQLARLPRAALDSVADQAARWLDPRYPPPDASDLPVEIDNVDSLVSAVTFQAAALFALRSKPDAFVSSGVEAGVLNDTIAPIIQSFGAECLAPHGSEIQKAVARARSSVEVVPSFVNFDAAIDLRLVTTDDEYVPSVVPMALAVLQTDVSNQHLIFQMTPRDVYNLHQHLGSLIDKFRAYENAAVVLSPERG